MPRLKQFEERYAREDFSREIRAKRGYYDYATVADLGAALGMPTSTIRAKLLDPEGLKIRELRGLIKTLHLSPEIVLRFIGYDAKTIRAFRLAQKGGGADALDWPE